MLNSGKKISASRNKKKNILTLMLSEKKILNETKNHTILGILVSYMKNQSNTC